ncbi:MAG: hypothetical protein JWO15_3630 [Sphingomonadales bacterium]|nr:hypothetical protein [Sphingomonadales bacterium]
MDYYVRKDGQSEPLLARVSFTVANAAARRYSQDDKLGISQVYTIVGERAGDPASTEPRIEVVSIYQRGKIMLGGKIANERSLKNLPIAL